MQADEIARRTIDRLTRNPMDYQQAIARQPDETDETYYARLETIAADSSGMVMLITINEVAQRQRPPDDDTDAAPPDLTPLSRRVIPIMFPPKSL